MDEENPETTCDTRRWWLSTGGEPEGPHSEGYILIGLKTGEIPSSALVCPVGGQEWKPISGWPEFAQSAASKTPISPPTLPNVAAQTSAPVLTNPLLPSMANWICVYAIVVSPFLWFVQNLSCCITFSPLYREDSTFFIIEFGLYMLEALVTLGVAILFVVGGIRLKNLQGDSIVRLALWLGLGSVALFILCYGVLGGIAGGLGGQPFVDFAEQTATTAQDLISFASLIVGLAELAFQIVAFVWLYRNAKSLPFTET